MSKIVLLLTIIILFNGTDVTAKNLHSILYEQYENYTETAIKHKRFRHDDLIKLIEKAGKSKTFAVTKLGESIEKRGIYLIKAGKGPHKVLAWSQMHGDESTATMALLDIFRFLSADDELNPVREKLLNNITFYFIPMLNPDGAERFQRRNAADIDLNRDAALLQSPESIILKKLRDTVDAEFAFNLHDQMPRYSTGNSYRSATLSFLAPPFDVSRNINEVRSKAMRIIIKMNDMLKCFIPGHTAKYSDEFEPRAFGDNMQKWGSSTILIESGGWPYDYERQFVRKLNFVSLISAFSWISDGTYNDIPLDRYYEIPDNEKYIFDVILRNVYFEFSPGHSFKIDVGINRNENEGSGSELYFNSVVADTGDLSVFYGFEEINCGDMEVIGGKTYEHVFGSLGELDDIDAEDLLSRGYTTLVVNAPETDIKYSVYPFNLIFGKKVPASGNNAFLFAINTPANYIIKDKGKIRFAIVNGFIYDLLTSTNNVYNGVVSSKL